jgi:lipoprotein LprG
MFRRVIPLMLVLLTLMACGKADVDPAQLATQGADAFEKVDTFHFKLDVSEGKSAPINEIELISAEGDSQRPDRLSATLKARPVGVPIAANSNIIIIGVEAWITPNPFDLTKYEKMTDTGGLERFSPAKGVSDVLRGMRNLTYVGEEDVDGTTTHHIAGVTDAKTLEAITGGVASAGEVKIDLWLGKDDSFLRKMVAVGALDPAEEATITRTIVVSKFNESVTIEAP